jgi:hypothetical protein
LLLLPGIRTPQQLFASPAEYSAAAGVSALLSYHLGLHWPTEIRLNALIIHQPWFVLTQCWRRNVEHLLTSKSR